MRNGKHTAILAVAVEGANNKTKKENKKEQMFSVYRPNTGLQFRQESLAELEKKYKKASDTDKNYHLSTKRANFRVTKTQVESSEAEEAWIQQYDASVNTCSHAYWRGNCRNVSMGHDCEVGLRRRTYNVVSGSVLSVWSRVEGVLASKNGSQNNKMQVIRLRTKEDLKVVGEYGKRGWIYGISECCV